MTASDPTLRPTAEECLALPPIADADIKAGIVLPDRTPRRAPTLNAAKIATLKPLVPSARAASVKRISHFRRRPSQHTFESDPG
jgi:hypothetical protein